MFQINDMTTLDVNAEYLREFLANLRPVEGPAGESAEPARADGGRTSGRGRQAGPCDQAPLTEGI